MAYKFEDLARTSPPLPGDLDRSKRRQRRTLSPDRQRELLDILDREDRKQQSILDNMSAVIVRGATDASENPTAIIEQEDLDQATQQ